MITCQKCQTKNQPNAEACGQCGTNLLPGTSFPERLLGLALGVIIGAIGYSLIPVPELALLWLGIFAAGGLYAAFQTASQAENYMARSKRHLELDPQQALLDINQAIMLSKENERSKILKQSKQLYEKLGLSEDGKRFSARLDPAAGTRLKEAIHKAQAETPPGKILLALRVSSTDKQEFEATYGEVEQIRAYLRNPDPEVRAATARLMGDNIEGLVTQILVDLLGDVNLQVRQAVVEAIWQRERTINCRLTLDCLQDEIGYGHEGSLLGPTKARQALSLLIQNAPDEAARNEIQEQIKLRFGAEAGAAAGPVSGQPPAAAPPPATITRSEIHALMDRLETMPYPEILRIRQKNIGDWERTILIRVKDRPGISFEWVFKDWQWMVVEGQPYPPDLVVSADEKTLLQEFTQTPLFSRLEFSLPDGSKEWPLRDANNFKLLCCTMIEYTQT